MDSVHKQVAPQGSIDLTEMISSGEPCVDVHREPHVMQDREYCVRLHTSKRIYYIQFDSEIDRQTFLNATQTALQAYRSALI